MSPSLTKDSIPSVRSYPIFIEIGRKSPALAQLRGQPGVTTRNVSSFSQ